ncbi:MAG: protein-L-isoaspartate(D-aspartate) O-methyltransferase [Spirochaetaceae bacterium]|nr:protein-L-isoaspartate(D-aspartate) O-methyltransferase [Spirochaetaceae bacterium]
MRDMVNSQIIRRGIRDPLVLKAMSEVDRSLFVRDSEKSYSFDDSPLPIGYGQTISQPYIVAYMTEQLNLHKEMTVLEIGTGSGYQSAILSKIVSQVYSIERIEELAHRAQSTLNISGFNNVTIKIGDGYTGWKEKAPFNAIIATAAAPVVPEPLINQLRDPGSMIIPIGSEYGIQYLVKIIKEKKKISEKRLIPVRFVPFVSQSFI